MISDGPLLGKIEKFPFAAAFGAAVIMPIGTSPATILLGSFPDYLGVRTDQKKISPTL